tara:strand:- start:603 stop:734 length:132 start_codon:yes stop_codon:yes gene_type:complete
MDYFIGFIAGYYWYKISQYLMDLATIDTSEVIDYDWEGYYTDD